MTHPTDDPLRQRTQNETRWCGRCYRESVACICATRPNALAAAPQPAKKQTMCDRCDGSGYVWAVGNCPKCEGSGWVSSAPQPAPAPAPDERDEMIAVIHKVLDGSLRPTDIADTILAAGWTRGGDAAGLREDDPKVQRLIKAAKKFAGWTIGGKIVDDPENREKYPLLVAEVLELREALAALARPSA